MKSFIGILFLILLSIISCDEKSVEKKQNFDWGKISNQLKDSLIHMEISGHIPNSISGVAATEPEDYSKLVWILKNAKTEDFKKLLHEHPSGEIKAIAAKGLIRRKDKNLFEHFKFGISQDVNVRYYSTCQKLGGYFLREITHGVPSNLEFYFSNSEIEEINTLLGQKNFKCN